MATSYEKLYSNLLPKFRSYEIPLMTEEEVKAEFHDYIIPACTRFHVCAKDLSDRDDVNECFNADLSDMELEILSNFMLIEYIDSNAIRTPNLLKVALNSNDFNSFSNANQLDKLNAMHDMFRKDNEALLSRYSWIKNMCDGESSVQKLKRAIARNNS